MDDQELFRRGLIMLLGEEPGIEVVGDAADGIAATDLAVLTAPDVILLDVRMPRRTGVEACVAIKEAVPAAKIIMLTVSDEEADLYESVKNGAAGYLLKDSSIEEVAQAVRVVNEGQSLISPSMAVKWIDEFKQMSKPARPGPALRLTECTPEGLRMFTTWPAYGGCEEQDKGSITLGKFGDFAVLSDAPRAVEPDALFDLRSEATILGGKVVYGG